MSNEANTPNQFGFSSRALPGSIAEQEEAERLAEFQRVKALRQAEEERNKPALAAKREEEFQRQYEANQKLMSKQRAARAQRVPSYRP